MCNLGYISTKFLISSVLFSLFVLFCSSVINAQKVLATAEKPSVSKNTASDNSVCSKDKFAALSRIRGYLSQIKGFEDVESKVRSAAEIGSMIWECDPILTRNLFIELNKQLKSEIEGLAEVNKSEKELISKPANNRNIALLSKLKDLRFYLIALTKKHDRELAKQFSNELNGSELADVEYWKAKSLLESKNKEEIARAALKALADPLSPNIEILYKIRTNDVQLADSVYLQVLKNLSRNNSLTSRGASNMGIYVFVSSPPSDDSPDGTVFSYSAGGVLIVALNEKHPQASPEAINLYLSFVADFLLSPVTDERERNARYALGRTLLPHAQQVSPQMVLAFNRGLQYLSPGVSPALLNEAVYSQARNTKTQNWDNLEANLEGVQNIPDANKRDELASLLANSFYSSKDYDKALRAINIITDLEKKNALEKIVRLAVASELIKSNDFYEARKLGEKIPPGIESAIFWFRYAKKLREKEDIVEANQAITQAVRDARRDNTSKLPILLLNIAKEIRETDFGWSGQLLIESLTNLDKFENWQNPKWQTEIEVKGRKIVFRYSNYNEVMTFKEAIEPFIKNQPENLEPLLGNLKSERLRAEAYVLLAKTLLTSNKSLKG